MSTKSMDKLVAVTEGNDEVTAEGGALLQYRTVPGQEVSPYEYE